MVSQFSFSMRHNSSFWLGQDGKAHASSSHALIIYNCKIWIKYKNNHLSMMKSEQ